MPEINETEELTDDVLPIQLKIIDEYQRKDPILKAKYEMGTYQKWFFLWSK